MHFGITGDGYEWVGRSGQETKPVYIHRLVAYAHGEIDSLSDGRHVHHRISEPSCNWSENLQALPPDRHASVTNTARS